MDELSKSARITVLELLTLMLMYIKLTGQAELTWLQVLSPILFVGVVALVLLIIKLINDIRYPDK